MEDAANALWKHCVVQHQGVKAEFSMTVTGVHRTPLVRQVNEAVRIVITKAGCVMNSKSEWHQAPLVRIIPVSGLQEYQGVGRGSLQQAGETRGRGHCMFACWWLIVLMSADRQTDKKTYRLTDRQTGRETYRQTERHTDIQTVPFP